MTFPPTCRLVLKSNYNDNMEKGGGNPAQRKKENLKQSVMLSSAIAKHPERKHLYCLREEDAVRCHLHSYQKKVGRSCTALRLVQRGASGRFGYSSFAKRNRLSHLALTSHEVSVLLVRLDGAPGYRSRFAHIYGLAKVDAGGLGDLRSKTRARCGSSPLRFGSYRHRRNQRYCFFCHSERSDCEAS